MDSMDIGKQLKSMEGYDGPSMTDIKNQLKRIEGYKGSTVVLLVEDSAKAAELRRIIADAGNLPHVKVVHPSELDDFKRAYLGSFPSGGEPIADRLREVPMAKSEFVAASERPGKWKGRRAIERGWRR